MVTLPRVISRAPVTGGGAIVRDPGVGVAPAQALTRVAGQAQQLAFSFGEEQRKLNQFNETLERETRIRQKSSDLIEQSRNNPAPGHTQRVEEGLQNILNEELQDTEDAEVDFFIRRSTLPSIDREISNAKAFEIKQGVDRGKAAIFQSNQDAKFNARRAVGSELDGQLAILDRNYAGAVQRGILTREQAARGLARDKDEILQAKASDLINENPEEFLRMSQQGSFKFLNPKTAAVMDQRAQNSVRARAKEADRIAEKEEKAEEKLAKQQQAINGFRLQKQYQSNDLTTQDVTRAVESKTITPSMGRAFLTSLQKDQDRGGRGDQTEFNNLETEIRTRNIPSQESILTHPTMNQSEKNDLLQLREQVVDSDIKDGNPNIRQSRNDLIRDLRGSQSPFTVLSVGKQTAIKFAVREYDDRIGGGEDPKIASREVSDKYAQVTNANIPSPGDKQAIARALLPLFPDPQSARRAMDSGRLPRDVGNLILQGQQNPSTLQRVPRERTPTTGARK